MIMKFSISDKNYYENNLKEFILSTEITELQFKKLLHTLNYLICDPPNYHCRLHNDENEEIYFCISTSPNL